MPERLEDVNHIGIAVKNLEEIIKVFCDILGLECIEEITLPERGVKVAFLETGNTKIELLEGISEDSPISKFVERHGPGVHHLCFNVTDISRVLGELSSAGVRLIDEKARPGAEGKLVAFIHPKSTAGVLIELSEK
ncbi:MAG: methylmalonyl-CoA epimerase [Candidatus Krumholzibacteria bacterium]|nr:methylmalonyl-CoA epimerase [Candidatus Krumholzibacteria bacterium]